MLLVCGGLSMAKSPPKIPDSITCYPPVLAVVSEDEEHKLPAIMANITEPFIVRLSDKDLVKIVESEAGKNAMRRSRDG